MPRVPEEEVTRLASLARIELGAGEAAALSHDLESIIGYVATIEAADAPVDGTVTGGQFREDGSADRIGADSARNAFPESDGLFLKVPRVLPSNE